VTAGEGAGLEVLPVTGLPEFVPGDDLAAAIVGSAQLRDGDVVVVSQKIISKIEGALVSPDPDESPADARRRIAREQAVAVVADTPWVLIVRTRHGLVCANAGIDASNVADGALSLLPVDPDASAHRLRSSLRERGVDVAVIVADTFGRPWRLGQTEVAIGAAGLEVIRDERGGVDRQGMTLEVTETAVADELAAAADLVRTKAAGVPVVVVRGFAFVPSDMATAHDLVRGAGDDLFARGSRMLGAALQSPWPEQWDSGLSDDDLRLALAVAPDAVVVSQGPPAVLAVGDGVEAGLAAAVLADCGLSVLWRRQDGRVVIEAGRGAVAHH
jgi:coenzyme F420-0:L-glutamate ligase/coenzyme F420-1:gamma-L-glutamate ligase